MKLQTRFSLIITALVTLVVLLTGFFLYLSEENHLYARARAEQRANLEKLAGLCQESFISKNEIILVNHLSLLKLDPRLEYAGFTYNDGIIRVHTDASQIGKIWVEPKDGLLMKRPVVVRGEQIGQAFLAYRGSAVRNEIQNTIAQDMQHFAAVAIFALAIAMIVGLVLARNVAKPLKKVTEGALKIGEGELGHRINVAGKDEIGILADSFNQMAHELQELDELKDEFISTVSHDLRGPLAAIIMYAEFLQEDSGEQLSEKHRQTLATIIDSAKRLGIFVNNILDGAKIKAGKMEYHLEPMNLRTPVQNVVSLFGIVASKQAIELTADIPETLPSVSADPERVEQVLANLVSNAVKFTPKGGKIDIGARTTGNFVQVYVRDTGKGIPPADLPRLFQRFEQSAATRAQGTRGTGLGLYIVKQTIEAMHGQVAVQSKVGEGSCFILTLPMCQGSPGGGAAPPRTGTTTIVDGGDRVQA